MEAEEAECEFIVQTGTLFFPTPPGSPTRFVRFDPGASVMLKPSRAARMNGQVKLRSVIEAELHADKIGQEARKAALDAAKAKPVFRAHDALTVRSEVVNGGPISAHAVGPVVPEKPYRRPHRATGRPRGRQPKDAPTSET